MGKCIFHIFLLIIAGLVSTEVAADTRKERKEKKAQQIKAAVVSGNLSFVAERIIPSGYTPQYISGDYRMILSPDTIKAYLPYIGSVNIAPMGNKEDSNVDFTSTKFVREVVDTKKGWDIKVALLDNPQYAYKILLSVSKSGSVMVSLEGIKRQPISYSGNLIFD